MQFEPFAPSQRADPYPAYRALRDEAPVHHAPEADVWCVSRHADVLAVLKDAETFSSRAMLTQLMNDGREEGIPLDWDGMRFMLRFFVRTRLNPLGFARARHLIASDPPVHGPLRGVVNRGFTPRRIASWEPRIRELVQQHMAPLRGAERFDLMEDLAIPLPVTIIAEMLGVEVERRADFKHWSDVVVSIATGPDRERRFGPEARDAFTGMMTYLKNAVARRRREPEDDLISAILARVDGEALSDIEVLLFVQLLLVAGNETTTNLIGNAVHALLDHPAELARVQRDPALVPGLVEEALRFDGPIQLLFRTATRDVELAGTTIPAGATVVPLLGSANRDERRFPDPDRLDAGRDCRGHLGFGFGNHFCLGASLARLEARVALEALVPELARLERVEEGRTLLDSFLVRGPTRLPLRRAA